MVYLRGNLFAVKKKLTLALLIVGLFGVIIASIAWFVPQSKVGKVVLNALFSIIPSKKIEEVKEIFTATALSKEYAADEKAADTKYLNKEITVSGIVGEFEKNQDGGLMVVLQTDDPASGVECTILEKSAIVTKGQNITIKGVCSGKGLLGISLTDCVIKQ